METNAFDKLVKATPEKSKNFDRVDEVPVDTFVENILPKSESIEVMFENRHAGNLVSLIAPVDPTANLLFKWPNNFSWAYAGDVADSIKERVKAAGGDVTGDLRCSLSWFNYDDLDLHLREPGGLEIYYSNKLSRSTGGNLDVDMNAGGNESRSSVENICYPDKNRMKNGTYILSVHQYRRRETIDVGFEAEMEFNGQVWSFGYDKPLRQDERVLVAKFIYSQNELEIIDSLPSSKTSKEVWGIHTNHFHRVKMVMLSPNHWDGHGVGNRHLFFIVDGCLNDKPARGFFNEYLSQDLNEYRKVFEVLGAQMKAPVTSDQLSGFGFSSTKRNNILCRVKGSFNRVIKVVF
jgi:hypothetical protein